jgi:hypothetical protein
VSTAFDTVFGGGGRDRRKKKQKKETETETADDPAVSYFKMLKQEKFPNDLLFLAYNFYKYFHQKPKNYFELFEFSKIKEIEFLLENYLKRLREMK